MKENKKDDKYLRSLAREYFGGVLLEEVRFPQHRLDILRFFRFKERKVLMAIEIKGERDSLRRLKSQLREYLKYCNIVYVLTTENHQYDVLEVCQEPEFKSVGIFVYDEHEQKFVNWRHGKCQDLHGRGLNVDWITRNNNLYSWVYYLYEVWGCDI